MPWHGNAFRITGSLQGESGGFPWQMGSSASFDVSLIVSMNKLMNKQLICYFKTLRRPCDVIGMIFHTDGSKTRH